jgi:uncharacterized protein (TIGR02996 family)
MSDERLAALLRDVVARRRDDAPRLAYADALGDDPRAEFIRLQVARRSPGGGSPRERALWRAHHREWEADVAPLVESAAFARGFVEWIVLTGAQWVAHADLLLRRAPILDVVLRAPVPNEAFNLPQLEGLRSLNLAHTGLGDDVVRALAASTRLSQLRWLDLSGNRIGEAGMEALAASERLPALRWVGLAHNPGEDPTPRGIDDEGGGLLAVEQGALGRRLLAAHRRPWLERPGPTGGPDFRSF